MFCTNCGYKMEQDAMFCVNCGTAATSQNETLPQQQPELYTQQLDAPQQPYDATIVSHYQQPPGKSKAKIWISIAAAVVVIAFIFGVLFFVGIFDFDTEEYEPELIDVVEPPEPEPEPEPDFEPEPEPELEPEPEPELEPEPEPESAEVFDSGFDPAQVVSQLEGSIFEMIGEARYVFEQFIIPINFRDFDEAELVGLMQDDNFNMLGYITYLWEFAGDMIITDKMEELSITLPSSDEEMAALRDAFNPRHFGNEHIVYVYRVELDEHTFAYIIRLLEFPRPLTSIYFGIAYNETMGLNFFTLEVMSSFMGDIDDLYMFCFVDVDSRGSFFPMYDDRDEFIAAIHEVMGGATSPGATQGR